MGCGSCGTGGCSTTTGGCKSGGCGSGGCNKLNTYDWFGSMLSPNQSETNNIYEVRFKNTRKAFYRNANGLSLITGDWVVVESDRGFDVGQLSLGGILAQLQMKKKRVNPKSEKIYKIFRRATQEDIEKLQEARARENETLMRTRDIIRELDLDMKASDVEFQGDNTKAIFYYIADQRVDFRELIKLLANEFRIRVEMKQIGLRHESGLVGGIGSCGRELCCSTWLTDFKSVSTSAARYQNLSLNPMKISGQCGRLKCCLNFELEAYLDALKDIPEIDKIETEQGVAFLQKTDIFKGTMWFSYKNETTWIPLDVSKVQIMKEMNARGEMPASLRILEEAVEAEIDFVDVVGQSVLRNDPRRKKKKKKSGNNNPRGGQQEGSGPNQSQNAPSPENRGPKSPEDRNQGGGNENRGNRNERGPRSDRRDNRGGNRNRPDNNPNQKPRNERPKREGNDGNSPDKPQDGTGPKDQNRGPRNNNRNRGRNDRRGGNNRNNRGGNNQGGGTPPPPPSNPEG